MARCTVLGGGLSGLSTAYLLSRLSPSIIGHISLIEANPHGFGGCIKTRKNPKTGAIQDLGPHSARIGNPHNDPILRLVSSLEFRADEVSWLPPAQRFIYAAGGLRSINLFNPWAQQPFTRSHISVFIRRALERGPGPLSKDISVDEFLRTRFDDEFADYFGTALIRGICAVDSKTISVSTFLPMLVTWEKCAPNLMLGALKSILKGRLSSIMNSATEKNNLDASELNRLMPPLNEELLPPPKTNILNFRCGMQSLSDRLLQKLTGSSNVTIQQGVSATGLLIKDGMFEISMSGRSDCEKSDAVFICTPARTTGALLSSRSLVPDEITHLFSSEKLPMASIAVVAMEFDIPNLPVPNGFGHLLPLSEDDTILGVIYDSSVFPHMDGLVNGTQKTTRFTVMMSPRPDWLSRLPRNALDPFDVDDDLRKEMVALGVATLRKQLEIDASRPCHAYAGVWNNAIAAYPVGHLDNVIRVRSAIQERLAQEKMKVAKDSLHLVGSALDGVGVGDCVKSAVKAVSKFAGNL